MRTLKVMSIIGLVWFGISFLCIASFNNPTDYEAAIGWGIIALLYAIPFTIVVLVKSSSKSK
jgi:hypothetical protein